MDKFVRNLITEWRRLELPTEGETVVVAVSGGADSISLLLAIHDLTLRKKLSNRVVAAHFNHNLRGELSESDQRFVAGITAKLGIELAVGRSLVTGKANIEATARDQRYLFLAETAERLKSTLVMTGHTMNDQAETFLMNLIRGSGVDGLSGMRPVRELHDNIRLVRPLLTWAKRGETEGFCRDHAVEYCRDEMNEDTAFQRVRIRRILLPLLQDFNPNIVEIVANTSFTLAGPRVSPDRENQNSFENELPIRWLNELSESELFQVIRAWLGRVRGNKRQLGLKHIKGVARLALSTKSGRIAEVPGGRVLKSGGRLSYGQNEVEKKNTRN